MALRPIVAASDGQKITVDTLTKNPMVIPKRMIKLMENEFLMEALLRNAGTNPAGVAIFEESTPLFANEGSFVREEFAEYRIVTTSDGERKVAVSVDRGMGIMISDKMRRRNQMDRVQTQMAQIKNTLIRDWDTAMYNAIVASSVLTMNASADWATTTTDIIKDIINAKLLTSEALDAGGQAGNFLAFTPDTIVFNTADQYHPVLNDTIGALYRGNIADQGLKYKGTLPRQLIDLDCLVSRTWPAGKVLICERKTFGFYSDEESLRATPLREDQDKRTWRADINRNTLIGIDQPKAAVLLDIDI